jgi:hypothetical protein
LALIFRRPTTVEQRLMLIRDLCLLKGINPRRGQDRRRDTLTGARLNATIIKLGVPPDDEPPTVVWTRLGLDPGPRTNLEDFEFTGLAALNWDVAAAPDIERQEILERYDCDVIATRFRGGIETERLRIERLNDQHEAWLESITGKIVEVITDDRSHPAGFNQDVAIDAIGKEVGWGIRERRNRHNDLLEETEKYDRRGRRYRPNKAGPCRTLTGDELVAAIAALRPAKNHSKPYPRGNEKCLFDACRRVRHKPLTQYAAYVPHVEPPEQVEEHRPELVIDVPTDWQSRGYSFADELMTLKSK